MARQVSLVTAAELYSCMLRVYTLLTFTITTTSIATTIDAATANAAATATASATASATARSAVMANATTTADATTAIAITTFPACNVFSTKAIADTGVADITLEESCGPWHGAGRMHGHAHSLNCHLAVDRSVITDRELLITNDRLAKSGSSMAITNRLSDFA